MIAVVIIGTVSPDLAQRLHRARQVVLDALGEHVATGPHREIHGAEPGLGDRRADVGEREPLEVLGEDRDHRLVDASVTRGSASGTPAPQCARTVRSAARATNSRRLGFPAAAVPLTA